MTDSIRWHYTICLDGWLGSILSSGVIRPATTGVPDHERPAVWFSSNQVWEETANKRIVDEFGPITILRVNKQSTLENGEGLARIGVTPNVAPHNWNDYKRLSGIKPKESRGLYQAAIEVGARPGEWWVSFEPVTRDKWIAVEVSYDGETWEPHPDFVPESVAG